MSRRLLAIDFDGVLWDSVPECWHLSLMVWKIVENADYTGNYEEFRKFRFLVQCGGEFGILMRLLQRGLNRLSPGPAVTPQAEEEARRLFLKEAMDNQEWADRFTDVFMEERTKIRLKTPEVWLGWQRPFPQSVEAIPMLQERFSDVVVCTTKDEESAYLLLDSAHLKMQVYGLSFGTDKSAHFRHLMATRHLEPNQIVFIDDLYKNSAKAAELGLIPALAAWGYGTQGMMDRARANGWRVPNSLAELADLAYA